MRLGILKSPPQFHPLLLELKALTNYHVSAINQELMAQWIASGALDRHLRKMKKVYAQRQAACYQHLSRLPLEHLETPTGGMAIYLETHYTYQQLCSKAQQKGLYITPGFALPEIHQWDQKDKLNYQNGLRIGFCHQSMEQTTAAIDIFKLT